MHVGFHSNGVFKEDKSHFFHLQLHFLKTSDMIFQRYLRDGAFKEDNSCFYHHDQLHFLKITDRYLRNGAFKARG